MSSALIPASTVAASPTGEQAADRTTRVAPSVVDAGSGHLTSISQETGEDAIEIDGLSGKYREIAKRYSYETAATKCPNCGGVDFPWQGWFSCDGKRDCRLVALVADGRAFIPVGATEYDQQPGSHHV